MVNVAVVAVASYTKMFHRQVNGPVEATKGKTTVPALRKLMDAGDRKQRKHERELRAGRVENLLGILALRSM